MWHLIPDASSAEGWQRVATVARPQGVWVAWPGGSAWLPAVVSADAPRRAAGDGAQQTTLLAPSSARVLCVDVTAGEEVVQGQRLLLLEAMKMEFAVAAPKAGRVVEVRAAAGEIVAQGTLLLLLR